jgi:hypothetical protein
MADRRAIVNAEVAILDAIDARLYADERGCTPTSAPRQRACDPVPPR